MFLLKIFFVDRETIKTKDYGMFLYISDTVYFLHIPNHLIVTKILVILSFPFYRQTEFQKHSCAKITLLGNSPFRIPIQQLWFHGLLSLPVYTV